MRGEFSKKDLERYSRQLVLKNFGVENQLKLSRASVLVIGAGGLGAPVLLYLAAAGAGSIGIADDDVVQLSNLQRQVLFTEKDLGANKAKAALRRLKALNSNLSLSCITTRLTSVNAAQVIKNYDIVIDCSDNFPTRYLANDACVLLDKPLVYGAILEFEGQIAVFNNLTSKQRTTNYRDLFPQPPQDGSVPTCEEAGVLGVLPGLIGCLMANEAIKVITQISPPLENQLLIVDALTLEFTKIKIPDRQSRNKINALIDYEDFCGVSAGKNKYLGMKECTVQELKEHLDKCEDIQLIDVRELHEYDSGNIGGENIPLSEVPHNVQKISKNRKVVMHCRSGSRSRQIIMWLEKNHGYENLYNLQGGIAEWAKSVDPSIYVY